MANWLALSDALSKRHCCCCSDKNQRSENTHSSEFNTFLATAVALFAQHYCHNGSSGHKADHDASGSDGRVTADVPHSQ